MLKSHHLALPALAVALAGTLLAACSFHDATAPQPQMLVIHGMLLTGVPEQEILVEYTRPVQDGVYAGLTPASGAEVVVAGPDGRHVFAEDPERPGVYRARFTPQGGDRYRLDVRSATGQTVTSESRAPELIRITSPSQDTIVARITRADRSIHAPFSLHWTHAPAASGYVILSHPPGRAPTLSDVPYTGAGAFQDTTLVADVVMDGIYSAAREISYRVAAVDANYRRYMMDANAPGNDGPRDWVRSTIQGGYGLFGSAAISDSVLVGTR
jgi:hypothetical protein